MSNAESGNLWGAVASVVVAAGAGLIGVFTGHKVQQARTENIEERLDREFSAVWKRFDRVEEKLDRMIEREIERP